LHKLNPSKKYEKNFEKLDKPDQIAIHAEVEKLQNDPFMGKKLEGKLREFYSIHCGKEGNIRVIYYPSDNPEKLVNLVWCGHRKTVYKEFERFLGV
jgi:mRNA-degrading endonuclease RelE of RelBE toxin-antitoxin system